MGRNLGFALLVERRLQIHAIGAHDNLPILREPLAFPEHRAATAAFVSLGKPANAVPAFYFDLPESVRTADWTLEGDAQIGHGAVSTGSVDRR